MNIILPNNMCEYQTLVFVTELIFCNDLKSNAKIPLTFSDGTRAMLTSGSASKEMSSLWLSIVTCSPQCDSTKVKTQNVNMSVMAQKYVEALQVFAVYGLEKITLYQGHSL